MNYRLIAAIEQSGGIGYQGRLPFSLRKDMEYFWSQVLDGVVIGTRRSVNQMGRPRGQTRIWGVSREDVMGRHWERRFRHWQEAVEAANQQGITPWIVGGEWLYQETLAGAEQLYLTRVLADYPADRFFPCEWKNLFSVLLSSHNEYENGISFVYEVRERLGKSSSVSV
jgi:dihydrofolate reductase